MYRVLLIPSAYHELHALRASERRRVAEAIRQALRSQPAVPTRNRKLLRGRRSLKAPPLEVWELRVGAYRVFYDVDEDTRQVTVRAVRRKGRRTTEEVLK